MQGIFKKHETRNMKQEFVLRVLQFAIQQPEAVYA